MDPIGYSMETDEAAEFAAPPEHFEFKPADLEREAA